MSDIKDLITIPNWGLWSPKNVGIHVSKLNATSYRSYIVLHIGENKNIKSGNKYKGIDSGFVIATDIVGDSVDSAILETYASIFNLFSNILRYAIISDVNGENIYKKDIKELIERVTPSDSSLEDEYEVFPSRTLH